MKYILKFVERKNDDKLVKNIPNIDNKMLLYSKVILLFNLL